MKQRSTITQETSVPLFCVSPPRTCVPVCYYILQESIINNILSHKKHSSLATKSSWKFYKDVAWLSLDYYVSKTFAVRSKLNSKMQALG